ncbi:MAG: hypothetical protein Q8M07_06815 [Prosthecobacter sp.]|nr:hypothetical protein [Prosthecobacter sp.]
MQPDTDSQLGVAFALVIKAVFLILAFTGHTSLWIASETGWQPVSRP